MTTLRDKTIWVTGASTGIGYALAKQLIALGNRVVITARNQTAVDAVVNEYGADKCIGVVWDIADADGIARVKATIAERCGYLDIAVLNAGTCEYIDVANFDAALSARVITTNVNGFANSVEVALDLLRKSPNKTHSKPYLLGVSSLSTYVPLPRAEAYGGSKAAVTYMLETLRVDLFKEGIDVSVINPGFVKTPLTDRNDFPMPFLITVDQAVDYIVKGMQARRNEIVFPPSLTWVLRILSWLPKSVYLRLAQSMIKH
jgi:short-subunit dehydrogenase